MDRFMQPPIYETKLQPPPMATGLLARGELLEGMGQAAQQGHVITVVAPAGSGKSTLLTEHFQSLRQQGFDTHWLSLDSTNDDPRNFAHHLIRSLAQSDPQNSFRREAQLNANAADDAATLFQTLTDFIASRSAKTAIFLDDFHSIKAPQILSFLTRLIGYLPQNVHLVLASRSAPELELNRRRMSGTLLEINAPELNLDQLQLQQFLNQVHQLELSPQDVRCLYETTEGWLAGLQLAAMAIKSSSSNAAEIIQAFSTQNKNLKDYLFQSVLKLLPEELRSFLLTTAPLSKMCSELCNAVCERQDSAEILAEISSRNLFLIPLDHQDTWFRYHHLFSEFLEREIEAQQPERLNEIRSRAAQWSVDNGYLTDAIQYYLDGGAHESAAELINGSATHVALENGDHLRILDWMRRLPKEFHDNNPELLINHAWSRAFSRDAVTAKSLCDRAMSLLDTDTNALQTIAEEERARVMWHGRVVSAMIEIAMEKTRSGIESCSALLEQLPQDELVLRATITGTRSYCQLNQNQLADAASSAVEQYHLGQAGDALYSSVWASYLSGICSLETGRLQAAGEAAAQAERCLNNSASEGLYTRALGSLLKVQIAVQKCEFSSAHQLLTENNISSTILAPIELLIRLYRNEARQYAWRGSLGLARRTLQQAQEIALANSFQRLYLHMAEEEVALQLLFDDLAAAMDTVRRTDLLNAKPDAATREMAGQITELQRITEARLMLANKQDKDAVNLLYRLLRNAEQDERRQFSMHLRALRSCAMWRLGKTADAIRELDKAISVAAPEGYFYPLASAGKGLIPVLDEIKNRRKDVAETDDPRAEKRLYESQLHTIISGGTESHLEASSTASKAIEEESPNYEEKLTDRELEILRLVAAGLNNKDLAEELFISLSTAKWHLQNIFKKLGVRNRVAALSAARKSQLIH